MMTDTYLMWKPISLVNLIYKFFVSDGKTDHLRKVCNNKGRSPFNCRLYDCSSYVSIHSQISFHRKF